MVGGSRRGRAPQGGARGVQTNGDLSPGTQMPCAGPAGQAIDPRKRLSAGMSSCTPASSRLSLALSDSSSRKRRASETGLPPNLACLKPALAQSTWMGMGHRCTPTKLSPSPGMKRNRAASRKVRCLRKQQAQINFCPQQKAHLWALDAFHTASGRDQSDANDHFEQARPQQFAHL